jgi:hypothetical protein
MSVPTLALAVNVVDDYVESTAAHSNHSEPLVDRRRCGSGAAGSSRCHRCAAVFSAPPRSSRNFQARLKNSGFQTAARVELKFSLQKKILAQSEGWLLCRAGRAEAI